MQDDKGNQKHYYRDENGWIIQVFNEDEGQKSLSISDQMNGLMMLLPPEAAASIGKALLPEEPTAEPDAAPKSNLGRARQAYQTVYAFLARANGPADELEELRRAYEAEVWSQFGQASIARSREQIALGRVRTVELTQEMLDLFFMGRGDYEQVRRFRQLFEMVGVRMQVHPSERRHLEVLRQDSEDAVQRYNDLIGQLGLEQVLEGEGGEE